MKKFNSNLYTIQKIIFKDGRHQYYQDEHGYLFSSSKYRTKIKPEDLPEWYIHGRYYKRFGYLSSKGIAKVTYQSNRFTNHFLKDDCLYVTYETHLSMDEEDHDERIYGNEILSFLKGIRQFSNYDIVPIIAQIKEKACWLRHTFPDEFGNHKFEIDAYFAEENSSDTI